MIKIARRAPTKRPGKKPAMTAVAGKLEACGNGVVLDVGDVVTVAAVPVVVEVAEDAEVVLEAADKDALEDVDDELEAGLFMPHWPF